MSDHYPVEVELKSLSYVEGKPAHSLCVAYQAAASAGYKIKVLNNPKDFFTVEKERQRMSALHILKADFNLRTKN